LFGKRHTVRNGMRMTWDYISVTECNVEDNKRLRSSYGIRHQTTMVFPVILVQPYRAIFIFVPVSVLSGLLATLSGPKPSVTVIVNRKKTGLLMKKTTAPLPSPSLELLF